MQKSGITDGDTGRGKAVVEFIFGLCFVAVLVMLTVKFGFILFT